jgi:hypothetical protein
MNVSVSVSVSVSRRARLISPAGGLRWCERRGNKKTGMLHHRLLIPANKGRTRSERRKGRKEGKLDMDETPSVHI